MEVIWSVLASSDIERIFWRIRQDNPEAARTVLTILYEGCSALQEFPNSGRVSRMAGRGELVYPSLPYIVVYQVREHRVEISSVYHAAQDWP